MSFQSPVSQKAWDQLMAKSPPDDAQLKDAAAFEEYANGLILSVANDPGQVEDFVKQIDRLKVTFGPDAGKLDDPKVRRALIVSTEPAVYRFDAKTGEERNVLIEANGQVVSFDSVFSQKDWNTALARSAAAPKMANADELLGLTRVLAERILLDEEFRKGMGSVENWFKALRDDSPSVAMQAIVCGGRTLGKVAIRDNVIREFQVGIRVAPSHRQDQSFVARSVSIEGNRMELLAPSAETYAPYGILVGNVETLRILRNDMALSSRPNFQKFFAQGIRVWGLVGRHVLVAENRISMATMGIRIVHSRGEFSGKVLWVLRENFIEGPKGTVGWKVTPPFHIDQNNEVFPGAF